LKIFIIAEIGTNWEGSLFKARKIITESKKAGADAVKFQMWRASDLYSNTLPEWEDIKRAEVTFEVAKKLKKISDEVGIDFFCSAFFPEAVDFLESLNVKQYKVASRTSAFKDKKSIETLTRKASTKKPIIVSMGFGGNRKKIEKIFSNNKIVFCYCIPEYPLNFKKINWKKAIKFDGFSDHTLGITAPVVFSILKKINKTKSIVIEKHVKLKNSKGPDASSSITTEELSQMVSSLRSLESSSF
jgi:N,N'-diacetyllegionaminate synthase